jgi:hypothetical protein
MHSSGRNDFLIQIFGAQHGLIPNLHLTQFLPLSRVSNEAKLSSSLSSPDIARRNIRALSSDNSIALSEFIRRAFDNEIMHNKAIAARIMIGFMFSFVMENTILINLTSLVEEITVVCKR